MNDLKFAVRQLLKNPGFATVAILTLALGIGANTAVFTVTDALILRALPVLEPRQLVLFGNAGSMGSTDGIPGGSVQLFSYPMYRQLKEGNHVFSNVAAMKSLILDFHGRVQSREELEKLRVQLVSGSYFPLLGILPAAGRLLTEDDDRIPGGHPVAVVAQSWWTQHFGKEPFQQGMSVTIGSTVYTIVGLTPASFFGTAVGDAVDLWIPLAMEAQILPGWNGLDKPLFQSLYLLGRLMPHIAEAHAREDINAVFKRILLDYAGTKPTARDLENIQRAHIELTPAANGLSVLRAQFSKPLAILMAVVALVLLIACANVANLMLARGLSREREISIRMALGAERWHVLRQLLCESSLLATLGAGLGVILAGWTSHALLRLVSTGPQPLPLRLSLDLRVLGFTGLVAVVTVLLFGLAPALRLTKVRSSLDLKEGKATNQTPSRNRLARGLLIGQVAISLSLLAGAGLFLRTFLNLTRMDTGFRKENVLLFEVDESSAGYKEDARLAARHREIEREVRELPGIVAASFSFFTFNQGGWTTSVSTSERPAEKNPIVSHNVVGPEYFETMGIPLLMGRRFDSQDTETSAKVAVINETFARRIFPGISPIGQRFRIGVIEASADNEREVVGLVKDAKYEDLREQQRPAAYYPYSQRTQYLGDFEVRFRGSAAAAIGGVRKAFARIDRNLPLSNIRTLQQEVDRSLVDQRMITQMSAFFALIALALACIGIYGVTSYTVVRQTREIGIRMALGAQPTDVILGILGQTLLILGIGAGIGLPACILLQVILRSQLFGLPLVDPLTMVSACALLGAAAVFAGYLPARRATRVDPMLALRHE